MSARSKNRPIAGAGWVGLLRLLAGFWHGTEAQAQFVPLTLTAASYNQDVVVEKSAPAPLLAGGYTTASMDTGAGNSLNSWYEQGYNPSYPGTGLPRAGTVFTHQNAPDHQYQMAPSYRTNNSVLLDATWTNATLTFTTPAAWARLSFLQSGGNGGITCKYVAHHQDGTSESGTLTIPDWFASTSPAWAANGRLDVGSFTFNNVNNSYPRLYNLDVALSNKSSPVASLDFGYLSGGGHGAILAVSGSAGGNFTPIAVTGYNADIVVEADGPQPGRLA